LHEEHDREQWERAFSRCSLLPTLMGGSFNSGASLSALDRKPSAELMNVPTVIVKRRTMTG